MNLFPLLLVLSYSLFFSEKVVEETLPALEQLKKEGVIRYIGSSIFFSFLLLFPLSFFPISDLSNSSFHFSF